MDILAYAALYFPINNVLIKYCSATPCYRTRFMIEYLLIQI
jgi:hypothetical protein